MSARHQAMDVNISVLTQRDPITVNVMMALLWGAMEGPALSTVEGVSL